MFESLDIFRLSGAMAVHAAQRQTVTATNIAQADTPGFRARRLDSFAETVARGGGAAGIARPQDRGGEPSPNGNTVSLETEMLDAVDAAREHARALAIYRHGLTVLRTALGR